MKKLLSLILTLACVALLLPLCACAESYEITLPQSYEISTQRYPVVYVLPQDGYACDDSGLADQLAAAIAGGKGTEMIIVKPSFEKGEDVPAAMRALVETIDAQYRTIADRNYRAVAGTGVGGYLSYVVGLDEANLFAAMASVRGDFASENNPYLAQYGDMLTRMQEMQTASEGVFDGYYTYMDAPVDDAFTNMEGSTNDLGALFIGFGTGSANHEFTVRPGAFDEAFLAESASRIVSRLTSRMLGNAVSGSVSLETTTLTAQDEQALVRFELAASESLSAFAPDGVNAEIIIAIIDPATGETLDQTAFEETLSSLCGGLVEMPNMVNGVSSNVTLTVKLLGTTIPVDSCTLIRSQDPVIDGEYQAIELMGDWHFQYVGPETVIDVAALTPETYAAWPIAQPGLGNWTKGYGNISDENVASPYGPDYFDFFIIGAGYYVKTFTVPENFDAQELVLSIGYVDDRCEVFLNGTRIGATGMDDAGQPTGDTTWAVYSKFDVDPSLIVRGGENTVVVRAWNDVPLGAGGWYAGPIGLYSKAAFAEKNGDPTHDRFFEASFPSAYAASALGQEGTVDNKYIVYLPEGYHESERRYPTVYLMHQFNSDHTSYMTDHVDQLLDKGMAEGLFDEMIVVIPNSDPNSWWTGDWEKMVIEELIPLIDSQYRTINDARYRLTAGCSMGGQGSFAVALRNPDMFSGVISFFGAFSYGGESSPNAIAAAESAEYLDYFTMYFICGNQDSYGFGVPAIELNQQLEEKGIEHGFFIENGGHDSAFYVPYFDDAFAYVRAGMYKADASAASLLSGSLSLDGAALSAQLTADAGISAFMHSIPASSYTKNANPALQIPMTIKAIQGGETVYTAEAIAQIAGDCLVADAAFDLSGVDLSKETEIVLQAALFDQVVELARISAK